MDVYHKYTWTNWQGEQAEIYDRKDAPMGNVHVVVCEAP